MKYLKSFFEKNYYQSNLIINGVDFNITPEELSEIFVNLMDELPDDISYTEYSGTEYGATKNDMIVVFERGIDVDDRKFMNEYQMYDYESTITKHIDEINNKLSLYDLKITYSDYADADYEFYYVISKLTV